MPSPYAVCLAVTRVTDRVPAHEIGLMVPEVEGIRPHRPTAAVGVATLAAVAMPPAPVSMPLAVLVPTRLVSVEVHDIAQQTLVTSIKIMSPANKREPGRRAFVSQRDARRLAEGHVVEIDGRRRGKESPTTISANGGSRPSLWRPELLEDPETRLQRLRRASGNALMQTARTPAMSHRPPRSSV